MSYESNFAAASSVFHMGQLAYRREAGVVDQLRAMDVGGSGFWRCNRIGEKSNAQSQIKRTARQLGLRVRTRRVGLGVMFWREA